jgi:hypothetical protein
MRNHALSSLSAIKSILINHSARIFKGAKAWLATPPENRFTFYFIPLLHPETRLLAQTWLMASSPSSRSAPRPILLASKQVLEERILAAFDDINPQPVVPTLSDKLDEAA